VNNRRVLISGVGIAGPTLAYWLVQHGFAPTLVERAPAFRTGGYMIDFWGVGYDVAERMGLRPTLDRVGYHIRELKIVNAEGRRIVGLDVSRFQSATRGRFVSLLRDDLAREIYSLIAPGVETIFGDTIAAVRENGKGSLVMFKHAPSRRFDLVIAADGLHSPLRSLVSGDAAGCEVDLGYYTAAFTTHAYPHRDDDAYVSFSAPGRQVARYALRGGRTAFFFVFAREDLMPVALDAEPAQRVALHKAFAGLGWECDEILPTLDRATDFYFDVVAQVRLPSWSRGRLALLGDAAYCPSLLSGQGAAFAMTGAYLLAHELARAGGDYPIAFDAYQRRFKPFIDAKQHAAAGYRWWFAPRTPGGVWLRNRAMQALSIPGLGSLLVGRSLSDRLVLSD
jgi:2-polyprenyl-6-methoxyphenol hydroxylase-like FAD-dependent oxidoreductase